MENTQPQDSNEYLLKDAPISKAIRRLSLPMIIGLSIGTVYTVINIYFIGLLKNVPMLTALTLGLPVFLVLMTIGNMFGVGSSTYITRLIAKNEKDKAKSIASYAVYSSFLFSILISIIAIIFINPIAHILGANGATLIVTKNYCIASLALGFCVVLNFTLEQIVRSTGATKESMYGMAISALVNLILDPLLILVFHFDLVGAAVAMSLANLVSAMYYMYYLHFKSIQLHKFFKITKISFKDRIEIFKIGFPEVIQMSFMLVSTLLLNNFCMEYGATVEAGIGISLRIVQVPEFISMGIFLGLIPLLAHSYSSKNFKRFNAAIKGGFKYILLVSFCFCIIGFIFKTPILKLFTNNLDVIKVGSFLLAIMLLASLFNGISGLFVGVFQATGKGTPTAIITITQGILSIPAVIVLHYFFGLTGVMIAMPSTEFVAFILGACMYIFFRKEFSGKHPHKISEVSEVSS
ncbi:MATE family efflux transporter [uncultured Clostridium sp.]|uniref:MATE family efflux transporter n=1 Tax=uncultured Clostridium sp. TaxID=59620 RepID=UPI00260951D1|nr:MATE family efflux transporter [uncultured Clostridium sp.]